MNLQIRSRINAERLQYGTAPITDTHWAGIVNMAGALNCIDDTQPGSTPQDLRRWAITQAVAVTIAGVPMTDDAGKRQSLNAIAASIENYVLHGYAPTKPVA